MPDAWDNEVIKRKYCTVFKKCIVPVKKMARPITKSIRPLWVSTYHEISSGDQRYSSTDKFL